MARTGASDSSQYVAASPPLTTATFTMSCFFKQSSFTANSGLIVIDDGVPSQQFALYISQPSTPSLFFYVKDSGVFSQPNSIAVSLNVWHHAAAVERGTSRFCYMDGSSQSAIATKAPTGMTRLVLSANNAGCADVAIWNVELSSAELAMRDKFIAAPLIRPQNLVFYAPLIRDLVDVRGGLALTNNGTTVSDHPRVYQ